MTDIQTNTTTAQTSLPDTFKTCAITTSFIDLPLRATVATFFGLTPLYPAVSAAVEFSACVAKEQITFCKDHPFICAGIKGTIAYSARAYVLGQEVLTRAILGIGNNVAYDFLNPEGINPLIIENLEAVTDAMITAGTITKKDLLLGTAVGTGVIFCYNALAKPVLQYFSEPHDATKSDAVQDTVEKTDSDDHVKPLMGQLSEKAALPKIDKYL